MVLIPIAERGAAGRLEREKTAFSGDKVVGRVVVHFMAMGALETASVGGRRDGSCAFAGDEFASLHGESQQAGFALH